MFKSNFRSTGIAALLLIGLTGCATFGECGVEGCAGDRKITANVRAAFDEHPELGPPNSINVETLNHVVYLTGQVGAGEMRSTAEAVAKQIAGVTRVEDTIYVIK